MKLIGYVRMTGEHDGKKYDDYRLFLSSENAKPSTEKGGQQIVLNKTPYGYYFPKISAIQFNELVSKGLSIGSEIEMFKNLIDNSVVVKIV